MSEATHTPEEVERERFEKWFNAKFCNWTDFSLRHEDAEYVYEPVYDAWMAWQAGAASERERLEQAEQKLLEFGQIWDGEKYVFNGKDASSAIREAEGSQEINP